MTDNDRAYDLRRRAERRGDAIRASVSLHLEAKSRRRARAMDTTNEPDDDIFVAADNANEVKPVPLTNDDISLNEFVAQLKRPIPIRTNPGNEREVAVPWQTRQERHAEEWLTDFERYIEETLALPPRERSMVVRGMRQHLHTLMSAAERRSVDLPPGHRLARLDRFLEELERYLVEQNPDTPLRAAVVRQQEEQQRVRPVSDLEFYDDSARETRVRTSDARPQTDLDYYAQCAADSTPGWGDFLL